MFDADTYFDEQMRERAPKAGIVAESDDDHDFLQRLFIANNPLAAMLPEPMLIQQSEMREQAYRGGYPRAMRRIIYLDAQPVGRFIADWDRDGHSHCMDIALMPEAHGRGLGLAILESWIATANRLGRPCSLEVMVDNPARRIYEKLGFCPTPEMDGSYAFIDMKRPPG